MTKGGGFPAGWERVFTEEYEDHRGVLAVVDRRGVLRLTLNRPERRNALSIGLANALAELVGAAGADPRVRVVLLAAAPPAFCAGADLSANPGRDDLPRHVAALYDALRNVPVPTVAQVAGPAVAGGVGLAAACDLSLAAESVTFAVNEVRLGLAPALISAVLVPKIRPAALLELYLTGRPIDGRRAADIGLVTMAVPDAQLSARTDEVLSAVLEGGPVALGVAKRLVYDAHDRREAWPDALRSAARRSTELFCSEEAQHGIQARAEGRRPRWAPPDR